MSRWFRYYETALNDPKVQRLSGDLFKAWVNLLCLASQGDGKIKSISDAAFALRLSEAKAGAVVAELAGHELLDPVTGGYFEPHNWDVRQFKSDVSTERVKRHRKRECNVTSTVPETPPDTDSETEQKDKSSLRSDSVKADKNPKGWPSDFREQFWKAYPKKVEKKAAFRRLEQVRRDGEIGFSELLTAVRAIKISDPQFVKHPATWLNKGCHLDPVSLGKDEALSDQEREQLFAKLREKPNDKSGERTELREAGTSSREVQGEGREGSAGPPDDRTRNAGMVSLAAVFRESSGVRAGSHETGSNGDGEDDGPRAMAARF